MRLLVLTFVLCLPIASAHADSSCAPIINAYLALTKIPDFTIFAAPLETPSQKKIELQGQPDGIYKPNEKSEMALVKDMERAEFVEEANDQTERQWADPQTKCTLNAENVFNGKAMLVYAIDDDDQAWIGKDDGLFYQIFADNKIYTLVYGPQK